MSVLAPKAGSGIHLESVPKTYFTEQDKARPPAQTVAWARERFAPLGGDLLAQTLRIDSGRLGIPVYISLCGEGATRLTGTKKQMGKGAAPIQAEASALMELAERVSFFHFMKNSSFPWMTAREADQTARAAGGRAMDFLEAARSVYHPPDTLDQAMRVYEALPQRWAWARNLTTGREELIPIDWFYLINEYNGPAAGNCREEAILQSLCEVVERHVSAEVTNRRALTPALDPSTITEPVSRELLDKFQTAGVEVVLRDYTLEMGIPSVAALCWDPSTFPESSEIVYAAGTATSPAKALIRALTEVAQLAGDFHQKTSYRVSALPKFQSLAEAVYVMTPGGQTLLKDLPDVSSDDFLEEIKACVEALARRHLTVYTLAVDHPELGIPAVYTIVPGAHFAMRTTGTDVFFHAARLAGRIPDPQAARDFLGLLEKEAGRTYQLLFFRGLHQIEQGRLEEGLRDLEAALDLDPPEGERSAVLTHMGVALKELGRHGEAVEALTRAAGATKEPHHEVFNLLGVCLYKEKRYEEAIEAFSKAIEIEPGAAINYANIGVNLRALGQKAEAARMFRHALDLDPTLDFARDFLAELED